MGAVWWCLHPFIMNETLKLAHIAAHLNAGVILGDPPPPGISVPARICIPLQRQPGVKKKKKKRKKGSFFFFSFFFFFFFLSFLSISQSQKVCRTTLPKSVSQWLASPRRTNFIHYVTIARALGKSRPRSWNGDRAEDHPANEQFMATRHDCFVLLFYCTYR